MKYLRVINGRNFQIESNLPLTLDEQAEYVRQKIQGTCLSCADPQPGIQKLGTANCAGPYVQNTSHALTATVTQGTPPYTYTWLITPPTGSPVTLTGATQNYTFAQLGSYNIHLTVVDSCSSGGLQDTASCNVSVVAATGSISCTTTPSGAAIALDGTNTGQSTPATLTSVAAGSHTVTFTLSGYNSCPVSVTVVAGQQANASCTLTPVVTTGSISCTTTPSGAAIALDGTNTGQSTPATLTSVAAGSHTVTFTLAGYNSCPVNITVVAGQQATASCTLVSSVGSISCSTTPPGASVAFDGTNTGQVTPVNLMNVSPGTHSVTFTLSGYNSCPVNVTVVAGQQATASCTLTPVATTGSISCTTTPTGAAVALDGTNTGQVTPVTLTNVSPGSHTVTFTLSGYTACPVNVNVTAGQQASASCTLASAYGSISCVSSPSGALVIHNGLNTGLLTPTVISNASPGSHTIAYNLTGYESCAVNVTVVAGQQVTASCTLAPSPGRISCTTTPPGAFVALDGNSTGYVTPIILDNIPIGGHVVTFTLAGYNACNVNVNVTQGTQTTASCTLTPVVTTGSISCTTTPSGAAVALDGTNTGYATPVNLTNVSAGSHTVTFTLAGYNSCPVNVTVVAGQQATASCTLVASLGSISCSTTPSGAAVTLDGVYLGVTTPIILSNVTLGSHTVTFSLAGYNSCPVSVTVVAGQQATASCTLTPVVTTGSISCTTTPPGASVALDGTNTGQVTPATLTSVAAGSHTVTFTLSGYNPCPVTVTVIAGQQANASCTLTPVCVIPGCPISLTQG